MAEIARVVPTGGYVLITVPAWPSLWSVRDDAARHRRRYRRRDLRRLATDAGFNACEIRGYQFFLLPLIIGSRLLARLSASQTLAREESFGPWLNRALTLVNVSEARLASTSLRPPTGSSLVMVARRR